MGKFNLSMRPYGWFQIGWSGEIPNGGVKPMRYFGHDLVAFRDGDGVLSVMDAVCPHLGAHLGYGGRVKDGCIVCPFHGWEWDRDGNNRAIPFTDRPNLARRIRTWEVRERHECIFMWHHPDGLGPQFELTDVFTSLSPAVESSSYFPSYPASARRYEAVTTHPQIVFENSVDPRHFVNIHRTSVPPKVIGLEPDGAWWRTALEFDAGTVQHDAEVAGAPEQRGAGLQIIQCGIGATFTAMDGPEPNRLVLAATPVDDQTCDLFHTLWLARRPGDVGDELPDDLAAKRDRAMREVPRDIIIWSHQTYLDPPALASDEVRAFRSFRAWAGQFYGDAAEGTTEAPTHVPGVANGP